jgi:Ca-activated chloride channel family protein
MEEERADIFTVNVGNLPANKEATITITYLTELVLEGDDLRFVLPTTIAPRYVPQVDARTL